MPSVLEAKHAAAREVRIVGLEAARTASSGSVPSGACGIGWGWIEPSTAAPPPSYL